MGEEETLSPIAPMFEGEGSGKVRPCSELSTDGGRIDAFTSPFSPLWGSEMCGPVHFLHTPARSSSLSPGGDIPPPGGGRELMFYGKLRANVDAWKRVPPQLTMP